MAAFDETEPVLSRDRCIGNLLLCGDADVLPAVEDGKKAEEGFGLPLGLSLPRVPGPRREPASPFSLVLGLLRRAPSISRFFIKLLWFDSELIVLLNVGIVVDRDCENLRPLKPGPGALMGVCDGWPSLVSKALSIKEKTSRLTLGESAESGPALGGTLALTDSFRVWPDDCLGTSAGRPVTMLRINRRMRLPSSRSFAWSQPVLLAAHSRDS